MNTTLDQLEASSERADPRPRRSGRERDRDRSPSARLSPRRAQRCSHAEADPTSNPGEAGDLANRRAANLLPAQVLHPDELIILLLKPSVWSIVLGALLTLFAIATAFVLAIWLWNLYPAMPLARRDIVLLGLGAAGVRLFWQFLEWLSRVYVLTDRRVIQVRGVLRISVCETPLKQIAETELTATLRERLAALGTVRFRTRDPKQPAEPWEMVARPIEVHETVQATISRYR